MVIIFQLYVVGIKRGVCSHTPGNVPVHTTKPEPLNERVPSIKRYLVWVCIVSGLFDSE